MLDLEASTLEGISTEICNLLVEKNIIENNFLSVLRATLLARHHHQHQKTQDGCALHKEVMPCMKSMNIVDPIDNKRYFVFSLNAIFMKNACTHENKNKTKSRFRGHKAPCLGVSCEL